MMLSSTKLANSLLQRTNKTALMQVASVHFEKRPIGNREIVGYGTNSMPQYYDRFDYPFPSIRFREIKGDLIPLKEKEKGSWKNLSIDEKKALYRASFCQTFSEFDAPTGEWKSCLGFAFIGCAIALILHLIIKSYVHKLPESLSEENRMAHLRKVLDLKGNPITGLASKWDYEKDDWKK